jgi:tetratricopeptide (TPR) repeat protein
MPELGKPRSFIDRLASFVEVFDVEQRRDDTYAQGGLNGQHFLATLACAPELRRVLAFACFHEAAARHKLALMEEIMARAGELAPGAGAAVHVVQPEPGAPAHRAHSRELYELALQLDPECAPARFNLGRMCEDRGERAEAVAHYAESARQQGYYRPHAELRTGLMLESEGLADEALVRLRTALGATATFGELHVRCARALRRNGDIEAALEAYGKTVETAHYYAPEFTQLSPPALDRARELYASLLPRSPV